MLWRRSEQILLTALYLRTRSVEPVFTPPVTSPTTVATALICQCCAHIVHLAHPTLQIPAASSPTPHRAARAFLFRSLPLLPLQQSPSLYRSVQTQQAQALALALAQDQGQAIQEPELRQLEPVTTSPAVRSLALLLVQSLAPYCCLH